MFNVSTCGRFDDYVPSTVSVRLNTEKRVVCVEASAYPEFLFFGGEGAEIETI
jgi:hypothetical protein